LSGELLSKLTSLLVQCFLNAQRLFQVLVGTVFLFLALAGAAVSLSEWQYYRKFPAVGVIRLSLVSSFTVLLIIFGLYSFVKARSIR
jgi:hypothetical protein